MSLHAVERGARWLAAASGALGVTTAAGCAVLPPGDVGLAWPLHPFLLLLGVAGGYLTVRRTEEIDARRWQVLDDPHLTTGEREWAHREAERQRRIAGTVFLLAPTLLGYWLAYQLASEPPPSPATFLPLPPLLGFGLGLWAAHRWRPPGRRHPE